MLKLIWSILLYTIATCKANTVPTEYYVAPDSGDTDNTSCTPLAPAASPCHTLQYYADNENFTSNAVFYFLQGEHTLSSLVNIADVENLSMIGMGSHRDMNRIFCSSENRAGFIIQRFVNIIFKKLFISNCGRKAYYDSGAFILSNGTNLTITSTSIVNSTGYGLAAYQLQGHSSITGTLFSGNQATTDYPGGNALIYYTECSGPAYLLINASTFRDGADLHVAELATDGMGGLLVYINCKGVHVAIKNSLFIGNEGYFTGNLAFLFEMLTENFILMSNLTVINGVSDRGPGITVNLGDGIELNDPLSCSQDHIHSPHHLMQLEQLSIMNNNGIGALMFEDRVYPSHGQDCAVQYVLIKNSVFADNYNPQSLYSGSAVRLGTRPHKVEYKAFKILQVTFENVTFANNSEPSATTTPSAAVYADIVSKVTFADCVFENNLQSAVGAWSSTLVFSGTNLFRNNSGYYGTGITLMWTSYIFLEQGTEILFLDNHASSVGGALYVEPGIISTPICFFQVVIETQGLMGDPVSTVHVGFFNNSADYAGSSLYGAHQSRCYPLRGMQSGEEQFDRIFNITNTEDDPSAVTSDPESVCFCQSDRKMPDCSIKHLLVSAYPGEDFMLRLAVVSDTLNGTVPGAIHAFFMQWIVSQHFLWSITGLTDTQPHHLLELHLHSIRCQQVG